MSDRKPNPGMLLRAAEDFDLDLAQCIFVGDRCSDMAAGRAEMRGRLSCLRERKQRGARNRTIFCGSRISRQSLGSYTADRHVGESDHEVALGSRGFKNHRFKNGHFIGGNIFPVRFDASQTGMRRRTIRTSSYVPKPASDRVISSTSPSYTNWSPVAEGVVDNKTRLIIGNLPKIADRSVIQ